MCTARLFLQGVDLFALKFYVDRVVPINHSWHQKTRNNGLANGEDHIALCSLVLTRYRSDRQTDRRTDGGICRSIYSECTHNAKKPPVNIRQYST